MEKLGHQGVSEESAFSSEHLCVSSQCSLALNHKPKENFPLLCCFLGCFGYTYENKNPTNTESIREVGLLL